MLGYDIDFGHFQARRPGVAGHRGIVGHRSVRLRRGRGTLLRIEIQ